MKVIAVECPHCGASVPVTQGKASYVCEFCGTQILIQQEEAPEPPRNEAYEEKMALARTMEEIYIRVGPLSVHYGNQVGYSAMLSYYRDAERVGGATRSDYWLSLARFLTKGGVQGFLNGSLQLNGPERYISSYALYMENAIRYAELEERDALQEEKEQNLTMLRASLGQVHAVKSGCYIATAVYGSYDCPEVWTLRRFRDAKLLQSRCGRVFVRLYYAVSPSLVNRLGGSRWFSRLSRFLLNRLSPGCAPRRAKHAV